MIFKTAVPLSNMKITFFKTYHLRSDVWSYDITMFEIFTIGENPYSQHRNKEFKERMRTEYE